MSAGKPGGLKEEKEGLSDTETETDIETGETQETTHGTPQGTTHGTTESGGGTGRAPAAKQQPPPAVGEPEPLLVVIWVCPRASQRDQRRFTTM